MTFWKETRSMRALIVYDSYFGNTQKIVEAIGNSIAPNYDVTVCMVTSIKPEQLSGVNLLIVGSPTRAFKPTDAIKKFLNSIPSNGLKGIDVLAFDTRISTKDANSKVLNLFVKVFGYATEPIGEKLQKKGGNLIAPPEGFFVKETEGTLKEGELERAANWVKG
jgi:flavodoxin